MARGSKEANEKGGGQLTVADYTQRFLERTLENVLSDTEGRDEKQRLAEANFLNLMHKLQEAGHKDDIRVPLRVLRDEIGKIHFQSGADNRAEKIETLFKLYDALEGGAQQDARSKDSKQAAAGSQLLDELRQRFARLVIGDTWDAWPQLKLLALKRLHKYTLQEKEFDREAAATTPPPTPTGRMGMRKISRSISGISSSAVGTWHATLEELGKAPGTRLLPLLKLLLIDSEGLAVGEQELRTNGSFKTKDSLKSRDSLESRGSAKPPLMTQPSGFSEAAETTRRISVLEMDDLLGLNEPNNTPKTGDPFMPNLPVSNVHAPQTPSQPQYHPSQYQQGAYQHGPASQQNITGGNSYSTAQTGQPSQNYYPGQQGHVAPINGTYQQPQPGLPYQAQLRDHASYNQYHQPQPARAGNVVAPKIQIPERQDPNLVSSSNPGSFNPFELPSPTYSSRAPAHSDNNFADFSPVAAAPHAPPPAPMRSQASGNFSPRVEAVNTYPQPPASGFDSRR